MRRAARPREIATTDPAAAESLAAIVQPLAWLSLPVQTVSEANRASHEPWQVRSKRARAQNQAVLAFMFARRAEWDHLQLPLTIVLVRHSAGRLDADNLGASMKHVQDAITDALGMALPKGKGPRMCGAAKGAKRPRVVHYDDRRGLAWHYAQRPCKRGEERVDVRFYKPGSVARWVLSQLGESGPSAIESWAKAFSVELDALLVKERV